MQQVATDYRQAVLDDKTRSLLDYAVALTRREGLGQPMIDGLRATGWSDAEIHDATQIASYFNYINRIADGLGCDLEPDMAPRG